LFCPKGCKGKYSSKQFMNLKYDDNKLPNVYKCPQCGFTHELTCKEKLLEIIYGAEWYFSLPEHCEMDEYYIEESDVDRVIGQIIHVATKDAMKDIAAPDILQIAISEDGRTVWINTEHDCQFRACRIKNLFIDDRRSMLTQSSSNGIRKEVEE